MLLTPPFIHTAVVFVLPQPIMPFFKPNGSPKTLSLEIIVLTWRNTIGVARPVRSALRYARQEARPGDCDDVQASFKATPEECELLHWPGEPRDPLYGDHKRSRCW